MMRVGHDALFPIRTSGVDAMDGIRSTFTHARNSRFLKSSDSRDAHATH